MRFFGIIALSFLCSLPAVAQEALGADDVLKVEMTFVNSSSNWAATTLGKIKTECLL